MCTRGSGHLGCNVKRGWRSKQAATAMLVREQHTHRLYTVSCMCWGAWLSLIAAGTMVQGDGWRQQYSRCVGGVSLCILRGVVLFLQRSCSPPPAAQHLLPSRCTPGGVLLQVGAQCVCCSRRGLHADNAPRGADSLQPQCWRRAAVSDTLPVLADSTHHSPLRLPL